MVTLILQGLANSLVKVQNLVQQGTCVVRMPAVVDTSPFHEHEEAIIASRQDIQRSVRHLGQGRNICDGQMLTIKNGREVAG